MNVIEGGFQHVRSALRQALLSAPQVDVGEWHSQQIGGIPQLITRELQDLSIQCYLPNGIADLQMLIEPNLPWAEEHFQERVSGIPYNPPPSAPNWPYAQKGHEEHTNSKGQFSHTYPERMWPKQAGKFICEDHSFENEDDYAACPAYGIRFFYGDLADVVDLLHRSPKTRQAYLPIWFPEDTGAVHGERVPCSLGYHFMIRENALSVTYIIRSCDFVRHFQDDVYMAARLCQWVREQIVDRAGPEDLPVPHDLQVGRLTMHTMSMHIFEGDVPKLEKEAA